MLDLFGVDVLAEVLQGPSQSFFPGHLGFPAQQGLGLGDVGAALLRVVLGQGLVAQLELYPGQLADLLGELLYRHLAGVADVHGQGVVAQQQPVDSLHQVVHVAEGARLGAVPEDGELLAPQGLAHEGGQHAAVVEAHAGAVGVEDPDDARLQAVVHVVGHGDGLLEALGLVVAAAGAHRVHVPPVLLHLRVHLRVAVHLRGGGDQHPRALRPCEPQQVVRAQGPYLQGLDRDLEVVDGRGGGGEVQDVVQVPRHVHVLGYVVVVELELLQFEQVLYVFEVPGDQVVHPDHVVALVYEAVAQVRA